MRRQRPLLDGRLPNFSGISLMKWSKLAFGMSLCVIMTQLGCQPKSAYQAPPAPHVSVAKAIVETVPIFLEENGQTEAVEQAVVQARVRGILQEIKFEPDSLVTKGTPLFLIEQQEYQAAFQSAAAIGQFGQSGIGICTGRRWAWPTHRSQPLMRQSKSRRRNSIA